MEENHQIITEKTLIIKNLRNVPGHHLLAEFLQVLIAVRDKKKGQGVGSDFKCILMHFQQYILNPISEKLYYLLIFSLYALAKVRLWYHERSFGIVLHICAESWPHAIRQYIYDLCKTWLLQEIKVNMYAKKGQHSNSR